MSAAFPIALFLCGSATSAARRCEPHSFTSDALRATVGETFSIHNTEHFVIAYDCSYSVLRPHVGRLEGIYDAALRFATACEMQPESAPTALPIIFFDRFSGFAEYARAMEIEPSQVAGFYHSSNNIAAFVNTANAPNLKAISDEIALAEKRLGELRGRPRDDARSAVESLSRNIDLWRTQRDRLAEQYNRFVLQHEAAHQVLFNAGIHARTGANPQWLVEGLACQFEVPQSHPKGRLIGINHVRLGDLRAALGVPPNRSTTKGHPTHYDTSKLVPLDALLSEPGLFAATDVDRTTLYAQSWALVAYLHREFPDHFTRYLHRISQRRPGDARAGVTELEGFIAAFGDPDQQFLDNSLAWALKLRFDPQAAGR